MNAPISYNTYQKLADKFAELVPTKDYNAYYDRPATLSLIEDVKEKAILDAGCGPGIYSEILMKKGANVTGLDISENMLKHAVSRYGDSVNFVKANLEEPLNFIHTESFDGVLSALAITYVRDISWLFGEFYRVLKSNGWFVFSTEHPYFSYRFFKLEDYFKTQEVSCEWKFSGNPIQMHSYYHSLGCLTNSLAENGFVIERIIEPKPTEEFKIVNPDGYNKRMLFPSFIHFKARKIALI